MFLADGYRKLKKQKKKGKTKSKRPPLNSKEGLRKTIHIEVKAKILRQKNSVEELRKGEGVQVPRKGFVHSLPPFICPSQGIVRMIRQNLKDQ